MSIIRSPLVLIADDDRDFLRVASHHLCSWSYRVAHAHDRAELFARLAEDRPDVLLLDVKFGPFDGLEILSQLREGRFDVPVAMLTAYGTIDDAVAAMRLGAGDYLTKPLDLERLRQTLRKLIDDRAASVSHRGEAGKSPSRPILGESEAIRSLRALIGRVAQSDASVLVTGESGTGKELVARAIHEASPRAAAPFVPLNMAAIPRELAESVLFGHAKGAFTGADRLQRGCCEAADKGTLFLDEIGEMELGLQAKLLRFLQERTVHRLGQSTPVPVDVRIIAATNRDPLEQIRSGLFREDLYYRLNVVPIVLPPLRDRQGDIPILVRHFLSRIAARSGLSVPEVSPGALSAFEAHDWPGNARELENLVERLAILHTGPVLDAATVQAALPKVAMPKVALRAPAAAPIGEEPDDLSTIERIERDAVIRALATSHGRVREAAQSLGLSQATIYRKIKRYNLST